MSALTVVIASHNAADTLGEQLDSLTGQPWPDGGEIIVADNRSDDGTIEVVERYHDAPVAVRRIAVDDRAGAGHARNAGVAVSETVNVAFCDADDVAGAGWVAAMTTALDEHTVVVGPLDLELLNPPWLAGMRGRRLGPGEIPRFDGVFPVASSCNLGINRDLFTSLGGFDDYYRCAEDAELSLRLWRRRVSPAFHSDALVHYRLRPLNRAIFEQSRTWARVRAPLRAAAGFGSSRSSVPAIKSWMWLAGTAPRILTRSGRARWLHVAGTRIGALEGAWAAARRPVPMRPPVGPVRRGRP